MYLKHRHPENSGSSQDKGQFSRIVENYSLLNYRTNFQIKILVTYVSCSLTYMYVVMLVYKVSYKVPYMYIRLYCEVSLNIHV